MMNAKAVGRSFSAPNTPNGFRWIADAMNPRPTAGIGRA
jgi:hypothetical protein